MSMWGGRFESAPDALFRELNDSLPVDVRLLAQDVRGSIAWAHALEEVGVLSRDERERLCAALEEVGAEGERDIEAVVASGEEDVHSWVESRVIRRVGDLGKKLHTGRSRNDQVATDLRLWTREAIDARVRELRTAQGALVALAEREAETPFPSYTHLQRAQPVVLGHWALAYAEMLERDAERFQDARRRVNRCPLGSAALAGTAYPVDREALARRLGFGGPTRNSLDAVSDRDFVLETIGAASACAMHLSRLAEDLIIYTSAEFGLIELSDRVTSGSSLMPQKKNPDALELLRGKCGRIAGSHLSLLVTLKGLPLAYNKDLQEDKAPLFDAMDQLSLCLRVVPLVFDGVRVHRDRAAAAAIGGYANATELADYLVAKGAAFRDAHDAVGRIVRLAIERGETLEAMPSDAMRGVSPLIGDDVRGWLTAQSAAARRDVFGGTAPGRVREQVAWWKDRLNNDSADGRAAQR